MENGLLDGEVLYHDLIQKTEEEKRVIAKKREEKMKLKAKRRKIQEENKLNKEKKKEQNKEKSMKGIKRKLAEMSETKEEEVDDDAEYFRQEVGMEPEKGIFFLKII